MSHSGFEPRLEPLKDTPLSTELQRRGKKWNYYPAEEEETHLFNVSQLDLLEPFCEGRSRKNLLQGVDREDVGAVGQATELGLAVADGHRGGSLHALVAEEVTSAAGTKQRR